MNIRRKAAAVAGSAALLSSLFAVIAAPAAFAAVGVTSGGNVAAGGATSAATVISFTENAAACFAAGGYSPALLVTITDSAGNNTVHFSGAPVLTAQGNTALPPPGSLGATASLQSAGASNNQLRINFAGGDVATVERFDATGLKISADAGAATGGVIATVTGGAATCVLATTTTATGVVQIGILAGFFVGTFTLTSTCPFSQSIGVGLDPNASKLTFNDGVLSESVAISSATATPVPATGATQTLGFNTAVVNGHAANTPVSQTVSNCSGIIGSPANVVNGTTQNSSVTQVGNNPTTVNPGEQNQPAGTSTWSENAIGVFPVGTQTFTLSQPATGSVQFSTSPTVTYTAIPLVSPVVTALGLNGAPAGSICPASTRFYVVTATTALGQTTAGGSASATSTSAASAFTVGWDAVAGATGYNIYEAATGVGPFGLIGGVLAPVTTFTDLCTVPAGVAPPALNGAAVARPTGLTGVPSALGGICPITTFRYYVTATTTVGETDQIAANGIDVLTATTTSSVTLNWAAVAGATGYKVYRGAAGAIPAATGNIGAAGGTTFTDGCAVAPAAAPPVANTAIIGAPANVVVTALNSTGSLIAGTYFYEVTATNASGESLPSVPAGATISTANGSVTLTWGAVAGATGYKIYGRPGTSIGVYGLIGTVGAVTTFTDTGAVVPGAVPPIINTSAGVAPTGSTTCNLSADRKSCTISVTAVGTVSPSMISLNAILLDVSTDATVGAPINVSVTGSPAFIVIVNSSTIAYIARLVVGIAAQPTIYINYNDQISGTIKLVESFPGYFNAGVAGNNAIGLCLITGETFTRSPYIIVTTGDVKLNDGAGNPVSQTMGVQFTDPQGNSCVRWTIYSASTAVSTIEIRGSDATGAILPAGDTSGPRLSVGPGLRPGTTQAVVLVGSQANVLVGAFGALPTAPAFAKLVSPATRAYKSGVVVSVVGNPPFMAPGSDPLAANITIKESLNGQLKAGDVIVVQILPRSTRLRSDVLLHTGSTNQLPIITTNSGSGLLVSAVTFPGAPIVNCQPAVPAISVCAFAFTITQQAFGSALGEITISNMDYIVAPDAALGAVQVSVFSVPLGNRGVGGGVLFNQVVTNAIIGTQLPPALTKTSASSAVTKTNVAAAFTVGTKVVKLGANKANSNNIVTIRIKVDPSLVGKNVQIQRAVKSASGTWSAFTTITSRAVGADGYAYYYASAHSAQWLSFRGSFAGNAQWAPSHSQTVQVRWIN